MVQDPALGILQSFEFTSDILKKNPLGDPATRKVYVYVPPRYDSTRALPALLALNGFTGTGAMFFNGTPFQEDLKARMDRLIGTGKCPPCLIVAPDCFTRLGGSQYLNSSAVGNYEDYVTQEIIPFIQREFRILRWGVFGKSSGGYGSMILSMRHPDIFEGLANHSGDSCFELCYLGGFGKALDKFKKAGGPRKWLEEFWDDAHPENRKDIDTLDKLAMSACYSPNPASPHLGIDLPFDLETGVFRPEVWQKWREWDPVNLINRYDEALKGMRLVYIDCGNKDEFALHWGARALVTQMKKIGVRVHHEEFSDGHMSIPYRMDISLPLLAKALS